MKIVVRILVGLILLLGLGLAIIAIVLPGIIDSPETRALIAETSEAQIGRPLEFETLSLGLLPPSIVVEGPRIAGETADAEALFEATSISLHIALMPLLSLTVRVDSLLVDGARIMLVRTQDGLALPAPPEAPASAPKPAAPAKASSQAAGSEPPVKLDIQSIAIRAARIVFDDRTVEPPLMWKLEPIDLNLVGDGNGGPVMLTGHAVLGAGGTIDLAGQIDLRRLAADLQIGLVDLDLRKTSGYAEKGARIDARLSGDVKVKVVDATPQSLSVALVLDANRLTTGGAEVSGPTRLEATIDLTNVDPKGRFLLDAGAARIEVPEAFVKPADVVLSVEGNFVVPAEAPLRVSIGALRLHSLVARMEIESADTTRIGVDAAPFDLAGWDALLPSVPAGLLGGRAAIRGLVIEDEPLSVRGEIALEPLQLALAQGEPATVQGKLVGEGNALALPGLDFQAGGQHVMLTGRINDLAGAQSFSLTLKTVGVLRANPLVSATTTYADTVFGPLEFDGKVEGKLAAGEQALTDTLGGYFHFDLGRGAGDGEEGGRLEGVSILRAVWSDFEHLGTAAELASLLSGGAVPNLEGSFGDEFERMDARLLIRNGHLETERLRIVYRDYGVNLNGTVRLVDQVLDMKGEIKLGQGLVKKLGAEAGDGDVVVPLAHVGGTVAAPEIDVSSDAAKAFAREMLARNPKVTAATKSLGREADKVIPGASKVLGDLLKK